MQEKPKNKIKYLKKISKKIDLKKLKTKSLLSNEVANATSQLAKDLRVRKLVLKFQRDLAYRPPSKYNGSVLDGRDITSKVVTDAEFKFYITANTSVRAKRRFKELKKLGKKVEFDEAELRQVIDDIATASRQLDSRKKGINVLLGPGVDPSTPVTFQLQNVPVAEVLKYVADFARLDIRTDGNAVVLLKRRKVAR